jgi:CRP/FNR family cyclic AMP-dependent transcriptional regulator
MFYHSGRLRRKGAVCRRVNCAPTSFSQPTVNRLSTLELLRRVPLFASLSDEQLQSLNGHVVVHECGKGETLFQENQPGKTLYAVLSGSVNIERITPDGGLVHVARRGPGEIFGEMSLIDGKPRMADAVTAERTALLVLEREDFLKCIRESPEVALGIMAYLADRLRQAGDRLENTQTLNVIGRLCARLLELAKTAGVPDSNGGTRLEAKVSQQSLAEQIGTTRESVNRALAELKKMRALRNDGRTLIIADETKLRRYCG